MPITFFLAVRPRFFQKINNLEPSWMLDCFFLLGKPYLLKGQEDLLMLLGF